MTSVTCDCGGSPIGDIANAAAVGAVIGTAIGLLLRQRGDELTRTIGYATVATAALAVLITLLEGVT